MNRIKNYPLLFTALPVLLGILLIYLPDLQNGFVWDDSTSFFTNPMYRDPANIHKALTGALIYQQNYFRPLPVLSFLIQIHLFEISALRMHLVSILLHVFNTFMVMLIAVNYLRDLDKSRAYPTVALVGLIYGLHPALIEPVSFISSRFDMMLTAFLLTALYADIRISNQWWRALAVGLLFLLAALCKEMAVGFAIALPLWHLVRSGADWPGSKKYLESLKKHGELKVYSSIVIFGLVYLLLRYFALGFLYDSTFYKNDLNLTLLQHLALVGLSAFRYLSLLFFPLGKINVAHQLPNNLDFNNYQVVVGYVLLIGIPALAWYARKQRVTLIAGFAMVVAGLLPLLGIIPLPRNPSMFFSESFLPFPVALLVLALIRPLNNLVNPAMPAWRSMCFAIRFGLGFWILLAAFTVVTTIPLWKSNVTLWTWAKLADPGNDEARLNLVSALVAEHQYRRAVEESTYLVGRYDNNDVVWNGFASGLAGLGKYKEARAAAEHALRLNPLSIHNQFTVAQIDYLLQDYADAESLLNSVLRENPEHVSANILLANLYKKTNRQTLSVRIMKNAISRLPAGRERRLLEEWLSNLPDQFGPAPNSGAGQN
ncbi:MAG: hypothetical protein ACWGOV_08210 [Acidiferrobacterales bacterium]